jgi:tetratricopeptide (TPR) repeat protein
MGTLFQPRRQMGPVVWCLTLLIGLGISAAAAQQPSASTATSPRSSSWNQIVTPAFIVVGNASTGELKRTLREVTRFRDTFAKLFPNSVTTSPVPTWVVVLKDQQAFNRFQPRDSRGKPVGNVGGYFTRGPDANFMVMGASTSDSSMSILFHEYTHYLVSRNVHISVPMWLNEGLADFYSTFRGDYRGRTLVGAIPPSRARALGNSTFVPLRDIVSPHDLETMWRWETRIGMLYAESWALVHYVTIQRKNPTPNPFGAYLTALTRTGNQDQAFKEAFGTDVDGMEKELREYVRRVSLPAMVFDMQVDVPDAIEARPMLQADVDALEGLLLFEAGAYDDAERELTAVVKQYPTHAPAQIAMARLRLLQDREDEAIASLQQVVEAAPANGAAQYFLGTALERAWRHEEALGAFTKSLAIMLENPAPWSGLSSAALGLSRDVQARAAIENAMRAEWSPSIHWTHALHALRLGRNDVAASSIATYLELRGNGEDLSVYPLFVRAIAAWRAGRPQEADAALALAEKGDVTEPWTVSVLRFLQGRLDAAQFLRAAGNIGQQTEARTYIGFKLAIAGRDDEALTHFRWVADRGAKNYLEFELATNELNRLKYAPKAPAVP